MSVDKDTQSQIEDILTKNAWLALRRRFKRNRKLRVILDAILVAQNGVCAICKQPETRIYRGKPAEFCIDHNHKTGEIRGLLCGNCNSALGLLRENLDTIRNMAEYVEEFNGR